MEKQTIRISIPALADACEAVLTLALPSDCTPPSVAVVAITGEDGRVTVGPLPVVASTVEAAHGAA